MRQRKRWRGGVDTKSLLMQLACAETSRFGVKLLYNARRGEWSLKDVADSGVFPTKNAAIRAYFSTYGREYGTMRQRYSLRKTQYGRGYRWTLKDFAGNTVGRWVLRPTRVEIAHIMREARKDNSQPSYRRPDTLGWRTWEWSVIKRCLISGIQGTLWDCGPELRVESWSEHSAVRGAAGIHACRLPRGDWRRARRPHDMPLAPILGLVERFGKFVLGTEGWRAEWVIIKELMCADEALARAVRAAYPEVPVCVAPKGHWLTEG